MGWLSEGRRADFFIHGMFTVCSVFVLVLNILRTYFPFKLLSIKDQSCLLICFFFIFRPSEPVLLPLNDRAAAFFEMHSPARFSGSLLSK